MARGKHHGRPGQGQQQADTLFDAIVAAEKAIYMSDTDIIEAVGYPAGSNVGAASKSYTTAGTYSPGSTRDLSPGAVAATIRYSTTQRTSKNHPIYLFSYFHRVVTDPTVADPDTLLGTYKTALETYADAWLAGFSDGSVTHVRAGPNGAVAQSRFVSPYATHRDFPS